MNMCAPSQSNGASFQANCFETSITSRSFLGHNHFAYNIFNVSGATGVSLKEEQRIGSIESSLENDDILREFVDFGSEEVEEVDSDSCNSHDDFSPTPVSPPSSPSALASYFYFDSPEEALHWLDAQRIPPAPLVSSLALADIQGPVYPFDPSLSTMKEVKSDDEEEVEEEEAVPDDLYRLYTLAVLSSSRASGAASPAFPDDGVDAPVPPTEAPTSPSESIGDDDEDAISCSELSYESDCATDEERSCESSDEGEDAALSRESPEDEEPVEPITAREEEHVDLNSPSESPLTPLTPLSEDEVDQQADAVPVVPVSGPPKKRKKATRIRPTRALRALSRLPPQRKLFKVPGRFGRLPRTGKSKVWTVDIEAVSCCHLAGPAGRCQFRDPEGGERCLFELPKDGTFARAHMNMHIDNLRWLERARRDPNYVPECPWCGQARTRLEQLLRHILDTHLLMFKEWCPCGGTNSRSNQKSNKGRHEDSAKHRAYLKEQAKKEAAEAVDEDVESEDADDETEDEQEEQEPILSGTEDEDEDDAQPEFVEGSSRGTKRRRLE